MAATVARVGLAAALIAFALAGAGLHIAGAQEAPSAGTTAIKVPTCATDPDKLGIERIVEIDTKGGGVFGSPAPHNNFLRDGEVVLTFDDGPLRAYTRRVLAALEAHCTRATFFMVGRMAAADPGMVREVIAAGHTVGSHTFSHKNLKPIGLFKGRADFELGLSAVTKAAGQPIAPFFRFPYLSESRPVLEYLKSRDTAAFFIDIDSKDYQTRNSSLVFNRVMTQLSTLHKGIILMHDIQPSTAGMIRQLLDTLHAKGYKVVHMVPKGEAATIAAYDASAGQALSANAKKLSEQPLADRSVVWTMAPAAKVTTISPAGETPGPAKAAPAGAPIKPVAAPGAAATQVAKDNDDLPWNKPPSKSSPVAAQGSKRPQREPEELPWQARVFAN